ncbi:uncharacterized protein Triagg1_3975 [Trichoderma aggressivum f. europaeum]|uniref:Protamine P1 n=1 Tax=Trichoderma aggressivum f. europaeum TaxID=173218 RepID=A0AAE1LZW7_9HYPO|nr:hypothetical protein Triagg1_3975 [Trichoderma aggressivum f. europaeum]
MLPRDSIYSGAVFPPQDIYYEGSEDEDYDDAEARRLRYEAAGQQFLAGRVPMLLSATLKGPFDEESGWVNPWRSKNRTANSQRRPESQPAGSQYSLRRPMVSASASPVTQRQSIEVLKNAECALPSPESLKQAPFTEPRPRLRGKVAGLYGWEEDDASLSPTKDGYGSWAASSPLQKLSKRKSKSSIGADSTSKKRRRVESSELEIKTPTSERRRARTTSASEQRTRASSNTSIYSHIRELTSKIPRQDLSSEEGDTFDSDDDETLITHPSADASSTHVPNPSSSLSSPFSQPSFLRALSPVSMSPAQTPSKQRVLATQSPSKSPSRPRSSSGVSCLSEAPTNLSDLSDLDALGAGGHVDDEAHAYDNAAAPESHSSEEELERSPLEFNEWASASATQSLPRATTPIDPNHDEPTSSSDDANTAHNTGGGFMNGLEANYAASRGFIMPFGATTPTRMAHPIIYNDADGPNDLSPDSSITALSSAQQPAANRTEAANVSRDSPGNSSPTKTKSPTKSSALQSLSPRNGRINSRPAPNKIAQPHHLSPIKSPAAADKAIYFQEEDSQRAKENVESKGTRENPLPQVMRANIPMSQPGLSEIAPDLTCKADHSKVDKSQEEPVARDTATFSTASLSSQLPIKTAPPTEMDNTAQLIVLPNTSELAEPSLAQGQGEVSADSQSSVPTEEDAGLDMFGAHTSEKAADSELTAVLADDHGQTPLQEQENPTLTPIKASESLVIPPQSVITEQPSSEDLSLPIETVAERPSTPEPRFAFTSFSSFMSPSPVHRRQTRFFTGGTCNNVASTSHGILVSSKNRAWRSTTAKKRVSWAPLPHETDGSGDKTSSETDTSSSSSRGRDRAVSPPPPPSTSLASDSLTERDMKFSHHFAAVADRSKGTQPQSVPTTSGHGSRSSDRGRQAPVSAVQIASPTRINGPSKLNLHRGEKGSAKVTSRGWDDDNDPTDIVQDIFNEMDDFLQVWDVDAELDEARKAEKVQAAAGKKKKAETWSDLDMDMGMDMDMSAQFF